MTALTRLLYVHWVRNFEMTDADQSIGPILGILGHLRSNQWLVLFRTAGEERADYYPFRKKELIDRLCAERPTRNAAATLNLPARGVKTVQKRLSRFPVFEEQGDCELPRIALLGPDGGLMGIGTTREASTRKSESADRPDELNYSDIRRTVAHACREDMQSERIASSKLHEQKEKLQRDDEPPSIIVPVFYGTDRNRLESSNVSVRYGNQRAPDEKVSLGVCDVSIPQRHRIGKLERPPFWKIWARLNRRDHVILLSTVELSEQEFSSRVREATKASPMNDAFVFVHGYNVSFESAALRTAQLATDLSFPGSPIMYSWPSKAGLAKYLHDSSTIEWSTPHLRAFIEEVSQASGAKSLHVIAHSMGSRALVQIFHALNTGSVAQTSLKHLIFAAPDVDAGVFSQMAESLIGCCARVTLYASDRDKALKASESLNGFARAGQAGKDILILKGVDTIDASQVDTDFLGHSGFATDRPLMQDVHALVHHNRGPSQRFGLEAKSTPAGTYWYFKA